MGDNEEGKLFVGGLAGMTTAEKLKDYFSQWGEVADCVLMKDKVTGNSRGFGFVTYQDPSSVEEVLKCPSHALDNKAIDPKPCTPKNIQQQKKKAAIEHTQTHKIFVGGIAKDAVEEDIRSYFERFGTVNEVVFVINKEDGRHKGFGFVTFNDAASVDAALEKHYHEIKGRKCEAKRAEPREKLLTGRPPMDRPHNPNNAESTSWGGPSSYGYGMPSGGGPQGGWGPMGGGNMGYGGGSSYGYGGAGGGNFPATAYPGSYGGAGGYAGYGYGYGSQSMGYAGGVGANGKSDGSGGGKSGYGGAGGFGPMRGGYGSNGYNASGGGSYANSGDASGRSGQNFHPYRR